MLLVQKSFETLDNYSYIAHSLNRVINTTYIPTGNSVKEIVDSFVKIQFSRSFTLGYSSANLSLFIDEEAMSIKYVSTSGTEVYVKMKFDSDMEFLSGELTVDLPDERIGGNAYEALTKEFYEYDWEYEWKPGQPPEILSKDLPDPKWLKDKESNKKAKLNPDWRDSVLACYGFYKVKVPGTMAAWQHKEQEDVYILFDESRVELKVYTLVTDGLLASRCMGYSFNDLLERLKTPIRGIEYEEPDFEALYDEPSDYVDVDANEEYVDVSDSDEE
jgi:hypothetical protein